MAYTLITHGVAWSTTTNGFTTGGGGSGGTASLDTTGADLIILVLSCDSATTPTVTDNQSNTYTALSPQPGGQNRDTQIIYCQAPTVGTGHTWTVSGSNDFPSICISAWSGSTSTPLDQSNGGSIGFATSLQTGSVTPIADNELIICALGRSNNEGVTIDSGMTILDQVTDSAFGKAVSALAYEIQTTATTRNPQWSWTSADQGEAAIATFKAGVTGPTDPFPVAYKSWYQRTPQNMRTILAR
jgi:hypothetical protein